MGYESCIESNLKVKKDKVEELRKNIKEDAYCNFLDNYTEIEDDLKIQFYDQDCKHYEDKAFVIFLKDFVEEGVLDFIGEDNERWGYYFDGKGKVFKIEYEILRSIADEVKK